MNYIKKIVELTREDNSIAGVKGANLGSLTNAGLNVPEGFVVLTKAFDKFMADNRLSTKIAELLKTIKQEHIEELEKVSGEIRELIMNNEIPPQIANDIKNALSDFPGTLFAVRSSANAEDLPGFSFAGQYDSFLNIEREDLLTFVRKCWASFYTSRAIRYRLKCDIGFDGSMAVIIQEMVNGDFSGVVFTLDPLYNEYILIEAIHGLGEKLVAGEVTPNDYFFTRESLDIKEYSEKESIDKYLLRQIAKISLSIESFYDSPQDIEFTVKDSNIFVLQARPITTIKK